MVTNNIIWLTLITKMVLVSKIMMTLGMDNVGNDGKSDNKQWQWCWSMNNDNNANNDYDSNVTSATKMIIIMQCYLGGNKPSHLCAWSKLTIDKHLCIHFVFLLTYLFIFTFLLGQKTVCDWIINFSALLLKICPNWHSKIFW